MNGAIASWERDEGKLGNGPIYASCVKWPMVQTSWAMVQAI